RDSQLKTKNSKLKTLPVSFPRQRLRHPLQLQLEEGGEEGAGGEAAGGAQLVHVAGVEGEGAHRRLLVRGEEGEGGLRRGGRRTRPAHAPKLLQDVLHRGDEAGPLLEELVGPRAGRRA